MDIESLKEILGVFLRDFPIYHAKLQDSLKQEKADLSRHYVHKLGSSMGMLCKPEITALIQKVEKQLSRKDLSKVAKANALRLLEIGERTMQEVDEFVEQN
ncbi:MAG: Hpt domain-containing protein [Luteibaculaceae bacterium]